LLLAFLLSNCIQSYAGNWQRASYATVGLGLLFLTVANVSRQDKLRVRSEMLWEVVHHLEERAPAGAVVAWYGGNHETSSLNTEEGIHLLWHMQNRRKAEIQLALFDASGVPVSRVEVPEARGRQMFRVLAAEVVDPLYWKTDYVWVKKYHYGIREHTCVVQSRIPEPEATPSVLDPAIAKILRESFGNPGSTAERLLPGKADAKPGMAELLGNTRRR